MKTTEPTSQPTDVDSPLSFVNSNHTHTAANTSSSARAANHLTGGDMETDLLADQPHGAFSTTNLGDIDRTAADEEVNDINTAVLAAESSGEEPEAEDDIPKSLGNSSQKRHLQAAKFNSWFSKQAEQLHKEESESAQKEVDDEDRSARFLFGQHESTVIIDDPREYQLELFERAKQRNTIAVLDTGSGKTLIAVLLLKHILDQELENRALGNLPRISFFLVDCVTLVFQQHAVLECNLDQKVERFCGEMGCDFWSKGTWERHFSENMVIVCTAQVLYDCLMHAFISMDQINLMIFDEAHHAKKDHAYARIIKDFYIAGSDGALRPKIFGMTASPVDAKVDVVQAAKQLETMLHSQIATTSDLSLLQTMVHRPQEQVAQYEVLAAPFETDLYRRLKAAYGGIDVLARSFRIAKDASSELGSWCADLLWSFVLAEAEGAKLEAKTERLFLSREVKNQSVEALDEDIAYLREAREIIRNHQFREPQSNELDLSSKVRLLRDYLVQRFKAPTEDKCIVFVQKRYTARALAELFQHIGPPHLRVGVLTGTRTGDAVDLNVSFHRQTIILMKFRKGTINCLFATSIAEEGLDIPDCNLVIRFNLFSTLIQYIQSRGRARHANSKYIHMIEKGNREHLQAVTEVLAGESVMRSFCESLPAERLLQGNDCDIGEVLARDMNRRVCVTKSGAKLTYGSSLAVLAHFTSCLNQDPGYTPKANYILEFKDGKYVCEVVLPEASPVRSAIGRPAQRKSLARRSAAFEACLLLWKGKYIDENLLPVFRKRLPAMRNAQLALSMKKTSAYGMRTKPDIWARTVGTNPKEMYVTVVELEDPSMLRGPYQPVAILTRTKLPTFPRFPLHFDAGSHCKVINTPMDTKLDVTSENLSLISDFTLRIFQDIFNKTYESDISRIPYWIIPLKVCRQVTSGENPESLVDWDILRFVQENHELLWNDDTPHSFFENRFVVDPGDGGRRFFTVAVAPGLKPLDAVPVGAPPAKNMNNILEYSSSLWRATRAKVKFRVDQPVIEANRIMHRRNWLDEITEKEKDVQTRCYICPQPLKISALPTSVAAMSLLFPAIVFRFESYLICLDACELLHLDIKPELALEALTKDSDNTEEHQGEQIHFQRGMGKNYERLEFLGDCFLKMATSISLYTQCPDNDEFEYHVRRMLLVCNKNLFNTALDLKLYEYIRSQGFSRRLWYPQEPKLLKGKGTKQGKDSHKQSLGDKTIADVCEALIGAALLSHFDTGNVDNAVRAVTKLVNSKDHDLVRWEDYYTLYTKPAYQIAPSSQSQLDLARQLKEKHDYQFQHPRLLRSAFQHPSYPFSWEKIPSYQRLEFLGDSLLDMACVNFLFSRFPNRDPQWLTEHKMAMVSNRFLGAVCVRLGFHKHLRHNGSGKLQSQIQEYVTEIQEAEKEANGAPDYWVHLKSPPKALPDVVEAYIGAVFVDSEFNYKEVERFFEAHIRCFFEDMSIYDTFANNHPTTFLSNLLTLSFNCTSFRLLAREMPPLPGGTSSSASGGGGASQVIAAVMIHDDIVAEGRASSGKYAKVKASSNALELLRGLAPFEFRKMYHCDCKPVEDDDGEDTAATAAGVDEDGGRGGSLTRDAAPGSNGERKQQHQQQHQQLSGIEGIEIGTAI
ncbi:MAG: Dicer-like protein 1 [Sclerophora amabilis]|nr:MAG: Dicer-like protein 1 [Sclerophora amabilis]